MRYPNACWCCNANSAAAPYDHKSSGNMGAWLGWYALLLITQYGCCWKIVNIRIWVVCVCCSGEDIGIDIYTNAYCSLNRRTLCPRTTDRWDTFITSFVCIKYGFICTILWEHPDHKHSVNYHLRRCFGRYLSKNSFNITFEL